MRQNIFSMNVLLNEENFLHFLFSMALSEELIFFHFTIKSRNSRLRSNVKFYLICSCKVLRISKWNSNAPSQNSPRLVEAKKSQLKTFKQIIHERKCYSLTILGLICWKRSITRFSDAMGNARPANTVVNTRDSHTPTCVAHRSHNWNNTKISIGESLQKQVFVD